MEISDRLRRALPEIAAGMQDWGKRLLEHGDSSVIDGRLLAELGEALEAVSRGESATRVFRQTKEPRRRVGPGMLMALVYFYGRAISKNVAHDEDAIGLVKSAKRLQVPGSAATIRKIAQRHRDDCLSLFQKDPEYASLLALKALDVAALARGMLDEFEREGAITPEDLATLATLARAPTVTTEQVDRLCEYLRRKGPHAHDPDEELIALVPVVSPQPRSAVPAEARSEVKAAQAPVRRAGRSGVPPESQRETRVKATT